MINFVGIAIALKECREGRKMKPKIGMYIINDRIGTCIIIAIHAAGTIDIQSVVTGRCYRMTGLTF
jgi:hypothetical protein